MTKESKKSDRHISRNGADKSIPKDGSGKYNWGSYQSEIKEAIKDENFDKEI